MRLDQPLPVTVLTGFLGSGKTTLLRHVLASPRLSKAAVVINEFGEIGLDHILVGRVDDSTVLLSNGCVCCGLQDDLAHTLRQLFVRRASGEVPAFDRIVIETTGLAEPVSVIRPLLTDQLLADCCRLDGVVTTVDAATGAASLDHHPEAAKQIAVADRLILTKTDLVTEDERRALEARIRALNPAAPLIPVLNGEVDPGLVFDAGYYNPATRSADVASWLAADAYHDHSDDAHGDHHHRGPHGAGVEAFCLTFDEPMAWAPLVQALRSLVAAHGPKLLRMKAVVAVEGRPQPVVLHGVQHLLHPPVLLDAWPDADRRSRFVFITDGVGRDELAARLQACVSGAKVAV
ncbi:MAG: GTP-binding protein [Caulobacteraceae bacterium]